MEFRFSLASSIDVIASASSTILTVGVFWERRGLLDVDLLVVCASRPGWCCSPSRSCGSRLAGDIVVEVVAVNVSGSVVETAVGVTGSVVEIGLRVNSGSVVEAPVVDGRSVVET
jgi:hypothetical protein